MKRVGVGVAVALTMFLCSASEIRAQTSGVIATRNTDPNFEDSTICPDGCIADTFIVSSGGYTGIGTIYKDATGAALPIPGGYTPETMYAYSLLEYVTTSTDDFGVGGGGSGIAAIGTLGTRYADGRYAGFYLAPNGKYYPIDTSKKATRHWKGKGVEAPVLNCPDDSSPDFGEGADLQVSCWLGKLPTGNRVKYTGTCNPHEWLGETAYNYVVTITATCLLKCPDPGTEFRGYYVWKCDKEGDNCRSVLKNYTCPPLGVSGTVYYDEFGTCSTARGWDLGKLFRLHDVVFACNLQ